MEATPFSIISISSSQPPMPSHRLQLDATRVVNALISGHSLTASKCFCLTSSKCISTSQAQWRQQAASASNDNDHAKQQQSSSNGSPRPLSSLASSFSSSTPPPSQSNPSAPPTWKRPAISLSHDIYQRPLTEGETEYDSRRREQQIRIQRRARERRMQIPRVQQNPMYDLAMPKIVVPELRLNQNLGRTVAVDNEKGGLPVALKKLGGKIASERLRSRVRKDKFHERPGLRRKRLAQERKEYRFLRGYAKLKNEVRELVRKGW